MALRHRVFVCLKTAWSQDADVDRSVVVDPSLVNGRRTGRVGVTFMVGRGRVWANAGIKQNNRVRVLKPPGSDADGRTVSSFRHHRMVLALAAGLLVSGCSDPRASWPPPPRNEEERSLIEAARPVVRRQDGWEQVAWVVESHHGEWRVQAWKIVHPEAKGRSRCSPGVVRSIHFDRRRNLTDYRNHL